MAKQGITVGTLGSGIFDEKFQKALKEVTANINDPNTPHNVARKVTMELTLIPTENREACGYKVEVKTKLAGAKPYSNVLFVGKDTLFESDSRQQEIGYEDNVSDIAKV